MDAVIDLAAHQPSAEITTAAIAKHMGVTQGALFKHFPSKAAILESVMTWVAERLMARVDAAAKSAVTPLAALQSMFLAHVAFVAEHPGVPRMLFGELQRSEMTAPKRMAQSLLRRYGERLERIIAAGQASGDISLAIDAPAAATLFIGSIQGLVMQSMLAGDVQRMTADAPGVFALYWRAIGSRP